MRGTDLDNLRWAVAAVLTVGWLASLTAALVNPARAEVFIVTSGLFGTLCGYLFARDIFRRANGNGSDG